jgi:hypothetical protein
LFFLVAVLSLKKIQDNRLWLFTIILTGVLSRLILIPSLPVLEDDYYRYLWDGGVVANGYNPFKYSPADVMDIENKNVPEDLHRLAKDSDEIIKNINYPHIRTIYPILSQFVFATAYHISPWKYHAWKVMLFIFDILLLIVLLIILKQLRLPLIFVSIYWLNPVVIHEIFNAGHMDLLALPFVILALYLQLKNKMSFAVISLAFATGFKLWAVVLLPLLLRNIWSDKKLMLRYSILYTGLVLIMFIPVLISNLDESSGFIKYAEKWVNNAAFYTIYKWIIQQSVSLMQINLNCLSCLSRWGILIIYLIAGVFILRKVAKDNLQFFTKALLMVAVLYLISPTQFPWYYTWIVPLLAIRPKISLLLYPLLLPLYQLNYLSEYIIYIEHIPILVLFILEIKGVIWKDFWKFGEVTVFSDKQLL